MKNKINQMRALRLKLDESAHCAALPGSEAAEYKAAQQAVKKHMTGVFRNFWRSLKCSMLKMEHLASDIKTIGPNPSKGAVEMLCEKYEKREPLNDH